MSPGYELPISKDRLTGIRGYIKQLLTSSEIEEPGDWQLLDRLPGHTEWWNDTTQQLVVCRQQPTGLWIAKAQPAIIDGEEIDINLTAGPTSQEIAEFLAQQYMAHSLVLAPITAMQPR